jgi:hypothetical protein
MKFSSYKTAVFPHHPTVDGRPQIIDIYSEVSIQSGIVIDENVDSRHDDARYPKIDTRPVF